MPQVIPIKALKDNYIWCIIAQNRDCIIVDPGEANPVIETLNEKHLNLTAILITHHHSDHTAGLHELSKFYKLPILGSKEVLLANHLVVENESINFSDLNLKFEVLFVPGHTLGHVAYYGEGIVFTGDTLFTGGCGKIFEGTANQMYESLDKLKKLPDDTLIYCGHEYTESNLKFATLVEPQNKDIMERLKETQKLRINKQPTVPSTLQIEKLTNPFLRCDQRDVIKAVENYCQQGLDSPVAVLKNLRDWKNHQS